MDILYATSDLLMIFIFSSQWRRTGRPHYKTGRSSRNFWNRNQYGEKQDASQQHIVHINNIILCGKKLEAVTFKYLGSIVTKERTSVKEIKRSISPASSTMVRLNTIWRSKCFHQFEALQVTVSFNTFGCGTSTFNAEMERQIQAFKMKS